MVKPSVKHFKSTVILENTLVEVDGTHSNRLQQPSLEPSSAWEQIEDAFFAQGIAEERATLEKYASLPVSDQKAYKARWTWPLFYLWTGCGLVFLLVLTWIILSRSIHRHAKVMTSPVEFALTVAVHRR